MPLRCAPPQNRPTAQELDTCRPFMAREIDLLPRVEVVLCLGQIALAQYLRRLREAGHETPRATFGHGAQLSLGDGLPHLLCSYHPSLQNTNTGRLTPAMMDDVLAQAKALFRSTSA
jgi:uracil-DNA glycosylase family 4